MIQSALRREVVLFRDRQYYWQKFSRAYQIVKFIGGSSDKW